MLYMPLYRHQGNLYKILRKIPQHNFDNQDDLKECRDDILNCDHVLQDKDHYLFCETIQEVEIIKE